MEDSLFRYFSNLRQQHPLIYRFVRIFNLLLVILLLILTVKYIIDYEVYADIINNVLASFVGIAAGYLFLKLTIALQRRHEDSHKVSYHNSDMWKQYGTNYLHRFSMNDSVFMVYFEPLFQNDGKSKIEVVDVPEQTFELDPFIKQQYFNLVEAHSKSKSIHSQTVRLRDFTAPTDENGNKAVIYTMRSNYLSHLLTNRALDYHIKPEVTIRRIFENTSRLTPLRRSKLSNHIGINALVFLKRGNDRCGYLLMPVRGDDATVAKNGVTASIATRLQMDTGAFEHNYDDHLTADYLTKGCILDGMAAGLMLSDDFVRRCRQEDSNLVTIEWLGISRDIYEGGKPTFFYAVYLNISVEEFWQENDKYLEAERKRDDDERSLRARNLLPLSRDIIDRVRTVLIADWKSVRMEKLSGKTDREDVYDADNDLRNLCFEALCRQPKNKKKRTSMQRYAMRFEQNMIANIWFFLQRSNV